LACLVLVSCGPGAGRLYRGVTNDEAMIIVEPKGGRELVSHVIFAKPEHRRSGEYARLDIRLGVDCGANKVLMKDVSSYSPSGALINTVAKPSDWAAPEGSEKITLRIACDRKFAASRTLNGRLDQLETVYRTRVAKALRSGGQRGE
jgi:hypothetical protein